MKLALVISDIQVPFHDKRALRVAWEWARSEKPDILIVNGDGLDCWQLSDFDKDPGRKVGGSLQKDADQTKDDVLEPFEFIKDKTWVDGNHEDRIKRYLKRYAPGLHGLRGTTIPEILELSKHGYGYIPYGGHRWLGKLMVTHGNTYSPESGGTAKQHFNATGASVLVGHSHRLGAYYRTNSRGVHVAYENGCLCQLNPGWVRTKPANWQQGFSAVHVDERTGFFNVQQVPILNRKRYFYGATFKEVA